MKNVNDDVKFLKEQLDKVRYQYEEKKEQMLAARAMLGHGTSDLAQLIGYNEGGLIHRRVDWRLTLIRERHARRHPDKKLIIALSAPRGWGKSTAWIRLNVLKEAVKYPHKSNLVFSSKKDLAVDIVSPIKRIIEKSIPFRKHYGDLKGDMKWAADEMLVAAAETLPNPDNNYTIETNGVDGNIAGKRYHNIFIDDIIGKNMEEASVMMDKAAKSNKALLPLVHKGGMVFYTFMRWGIDDWYEQNVLNEFKDYPYFYYIRVSDVVCDNDGNPLNARGEVIEENSPERIPNYPEKYPLEVLDAERSIVKDYMYYAQYRQIPRAISSGILDYSNIGVIPNAEYESMIDDVRTGKIPRDQLALIVDNANTLSPQSNPWAIGLFRYNGETANKFLDCLYFRKTKMLLHDAATLIAYLINYFNLDSVYVEKSGLEGNLKYELQSKLIGYGRPNVLMDGVSHEGINKKVRILAIQPFMNNGRLRLPPDDKCYHPYEGIDKEPVDQKRLLKREIALYPKDATNIPDDMLDVLGYAPRVFFIETDTFDPRVLKPRKTNDDINREEMELRTLTSVEDVLSKQPDEEEIFTLRPI